MTNLVPFASVAAVFAACGIATGTVTVTQGASAPTYSTTLTFDEPGQATGLLPRTYWELSHGVIIDGGDGQQVVDDVSGSLPWVNSGNSFFGSFGIFMTFDSPLSEFSAQLWDPSGPPTFFGGGFAVVALDNGVEVGSTFVEPAWGGIGDEWYNITTSGGSTFDEVRMLGFGFFPTTYGDNFSWNAVPSPAPLALLGLAGLVSRRRRA